MIPAILSCIFVIYLYQTLNRPAESETIATLQDISSSDSLPVLIAKLESLQKRLDAATRTHRKSEAKS